MFAHQRTTGFTKQPPLTIPNQREVCAEHLLWVKNIFCWLIFLFNVLCFNLVKN